MGTIPSFKIEEHMKEKLASEEEEMNTVIKPEYMKNTAMEHVSVRALFEVYIRVIVSNASLRKSLRALKGDNMHIVQ